MLNPYTAQNWFKGSSFRPLLTHFLWHCLFKQTYCFWIVPLIFGPRLVVPVVVVVQLAIWPAKTSNSSGLLRTLLHPQPPNRGRRRRCCCCRHRWSVHHPHRRIGGAATRWRWLLESPGVVNRRRTIAPAKVGKESKQKKDRVHQKERNFKWLINF